MAVPGQDQLELAGAGLTGLLRELLATTGATGSTILDTFNPLTPLPTLSDVAGRAENIRQATKGMQYNLPEGNAFRGMWEQGVMPAITNAAQQYPNEAELVADILSNPEMQGALTLLDGAGIGAAFQPVKQGAKAAGKAVGEVVADPELQELAKGLGNQFIGRGPAPDPNQLGMAEMLLGGRAGAMADQQGIVIPAEVMPARARNAGMEDLATEVEGNLATAQKMLADGASPEEIGRATGLQVAEENRRFGPSGTRFMYEVPSDGAKFPLVSDSMGYAPSALRDNAIKARDEANLLLSNARLLNEPERLGGIQAEIEQLKAAIADPDAKFAPGDPLPDNMTRNQQIFAAGLKNNLESVFPTLKTWAADSLKQAGAKNTKAAREKLVTNLLFSARRKDWTLEPPKDLRQLEEQVQRTTKGVENANALTPRTGKMSDVVEWDLLRALVPEVDDIGYTYNPKYNQRGGFFQSGGRKSRTGRVEIGDLEGAPELGDRPGLGRVHELNHGVEEIFNMPRGGSAKQMSQGSLTGLDKTNPEVIGDAVSMFNRLYDSDPIGYPMLIDQFREQLNKMPDGQARKFTGYRLDQLQQELQDAAAQGAPITPVLQRALDHIMPAFENYRMLRGEASSNAADARFGMSAEDIKANPRVLTLQEEALGLRPELQTIEGQEFNPRKEPIAYDIARKPTGEKQGKINPLVDPIKPPVFRGGRERPANSKHTIYENPKVLAKEAEANVEPPHPLLKELGFTRADMYDRTIGNMQDPSTFTPGGVSLKGKGAEAAHRITTPSNTERLIEQLEAFKKYAPSMVEGMAPWYNFENLLDAMTERYGYEAAREGLDRTNMFVAPHSANSTVVSEIARGLAARDLHQVGRFDDWVKGGSNPEKLLGMNVPGGMGTKAQTDALVRYLDTGDFGWQAPKVHSYFQASDATNPQTSWAVGDAHYSRGIGLPETRTNASPYESLSESEVAVIGPWWNEISREAGMPAVPGQAVNWGGFATRTNVDTRVGKPKVEFFLDKVSELMYREGVDFDEALRRTFGIDGATYYNVE